MIRTANGSGGSRLVVRDCRRRSVVLSPSSNAELPMLDIAYIRNNVQTVKANIANRGVKADVDRAVALDDERKGLETQKQAREQRANEVSKQIPKEKDPAAKQQLLAESKSLREQITGLDKQLKQVIEDRDAILLTIPNMTH